MATSPSFMQEYWGWLIVALVLHVIFAMAFALSTFSVPRQMPQQLTVKAELIDETKTKSAQEARARQQRKIEQQREREQRQKAAQQRRVKADAEQKIKADNARKAEAKARDLAEAKAAATAQLDAERKAKAESDRKAKAESDRKAKAESDRKAKAESDRKAKLEAERKARADAEQKIADAAAARRESELAASMAAEEQLIAARTSGELAEYIALIKQRVERNWVKPSGSASAIECEVYVSQIPGGEVVVVKTGRCNADPAVIRSVEAAVYKSSPLPVPSNPRLFERNLRFMFKPQD
ncbi:MAG: cell envelope integrity protein TolA [Gammaproteobacteria bacterium]|nr:cell envelope integrity protein TolA [Gammaproteobacteria bacterium]